MYKIGLQSGHEGRLSGATGTTGEIELNVRIRNRLSQILISKGFQLYLFAADPPEDSVLKQDFDLFLSLHGDMDTSLNGGCIGYIDPLIDYSPETNAKSKAIKEAIESVYFTETGIANRPNKVTEKITRYYMWYKLSNNTQCVLLEMGEVLDPHDKVLLGNTELIAMAIARGICKAFSVPFEVVPPPPPAVDPDKAIIKELERRVKQLELALSTAESSNKTIVARMQQECLNYRSSDKLLFKADVKKWADAY